MALRALSLEAVLSLTMEGRMEYFERFSGYLPDSPDLCYSIRVGSKTFHSSDTFDLRQQFDKYLNEKGKVNPWQ